MSEYQDKMTEAMKKFPKGISKEERGRLFCIAAKMSSGKFTNEKDAEKDCIEHPAPPRAPKLKKGLDAGSIARCLLPKLTEDITVSDLSKFIIECSAGVKIKKPETKNQFIKKCTIAGGIEELKPLPAMKLRKSCLDEWTAQQKELKPKVEPVKEPVKVEEKDPNG